MAWGLPRARGDRPLDARSRTDEPPRPSPDDAPQDLTAAIGGQQLQQRRGEGIGRSGHARGSPEGMRARIVTRIAGRATGRQLRTPADAWSQDWSQNSVTQGMPRSDPFSACAAVVPLPKQRVGHKSWSHFGHRSVWTSKRRLDFVPQCEHDRCVLTRRKQATARVSGDRFERGASGG